MSNTWRLFGKWHASAKPQHLYSIALQITCFIFITTRLACGFVAKHNLSFTLRTVPFHSETILVKNQRKHFNESPNLHLNKFWSLSHVINVQILYSASYLIHWALLWRNCNPFLENHKFAVFVSIIVFTCKTCKTLYHLWNFKKGKRRKWKLVYLIMIWCDGET